MNANSILPKLAKLREVLKDEEKNRDEAVALLDANVTSLKKEYNKMLVEYIHERKLLKNVTWKLYYLDRYDEIILQEVDWKIDLKTELKDIAEDYSYDTHIIQLANDDHIMDDDIPYPVNNRISLWLPDESNQAPYIKIGNVGILAEFLSKYELDVDITELQKIIDARSSEVEILNQIKQSVPN